MQTHINEIDMIEIWDTFCVVCDCWAVEWVMNVLNCEPAVSCSWSEAGGGADATSRWSNWRADGSWRRRRWDDVRGRPPPVTPQTQRAPPRRRRARSAAGGCSHFLRASGRCDRLSWRRRWKRPTAAPNRCRRAISAHSAAAAAAVRHRSAASLTLCLSADACACMPVCVFVCTSVDADTSAGASYRPTRAVHNNDVASSVASRDTTLWSLLIRAVLTAAYISPVNEHQLCGSCAVLLSLLDSLFNCVSKKQYTRFLFFLL